jgi:hypothetical protein
MITCAPYVLDDVIYPRMPDRHKWIFNKLDFANRFNIPAGPCGTRAPRGELCVRPVMNLIGMGYGGFFKVTHDKGGLTVNRPGYFWTPWQDGEHHYIYYVKDKPWYFVVGVVDDAGRMTVEQRDPKLAPRLPKQLRRISRYMLLETINGVPIEASARHSAPMPKVLADYRKIKPDYVPINNYRTGARGDPEIFASHGMVMLRVERDPYGMTGWVWDKDETTAVPL